ncbi:NAD(P)-binding protein [Roridomyces roridus]|uniref:NAD(P)-binding protein n=1 Tax=Roridomyces roridus TaxID=1738132 RepID=A0AAD7C2E0_9AGAR|nr:NAD(P)-binding protein [Roridomyces roridus]
MDLDLEDTHVLITGASGGIGIEIARLFLEQGARVTAQYNNNAGTLSALPQEKLRVVQADLSVEDQVQRLFNDGPFGPVGILVVNHGVSPPDELLVDMSLERWQSTIDTNLTASFLVAREYLRKLSSAPDQVKSKANILFVGSTAGKYGEAGHADYAASKSAIMYGLTLSLKNEIVKIAPMARVNTVAPGWVRTPKKMEKLKDPIFVHRALATVPLKKPAEPWDIATQVVCLCSTKISGHISGQVVLVDGGMEGRLLNGLSETQELETL